MQHTPERCLIVGPSWIGDMMMAQSLFIYLKQEYPNLQIDVLAPNWSEPLLAAMPEVRRSIPLAINHGEIGFRKRYKIAQSLREHHYDWSITLPNSLKSALIPFWAKIPKRTGYKGEMRYGLLNDLRILDKSLLTMTVERFVALGHKQHPSAKFDYPTPYLHVDTQIKQRTLEHYQLRVNKPALALCPGAEYGKAKRWPVEHYASIAKTAIKSGWQVWLLGSKKDRQDCNLLATQVNQNNCINLAGKTSLEEVIALLASATQVISNDSGLMHIAAATHTPLIAIYGSTDPNFTPPLNNNSEIVSLGLNCSPCFKRECPLKHTQCLTDITPERILSMMEL